MTAVRGDGIRPVESALVFGDIDRPVDSTDYSNFGLAPDRKAPGFNNSSKCLTEIPKTEDNQSLCTPDDLTREQREIYFSYIDKTSVGVTFNLYPSGEVSSGYFAPKRHSLKPKGAKRGKRYTDNLNSNAKKKIRRVGRNVSTDLRYFVTLTFDPKIAVLNDDGTVNHEYANKEKERFLNALSQKCYRRYKVSGNPDHLFQYICVGEIQPQTGNIHYHLVWNVFFHVQTKLIPLWGQASNSIEAKRLKGNIQRCIGYLLKYVTKEQKCNEKGNGIYGNRYSISQGLREEAKPQTFRFYGSQYRQTVQTYIDDNKNTLLHGTGFICDYGFWVPPPSRKEDGLKKIEQLEFLFGMAYQLAQAGDDTLILHLLTAFPDYRDRNVPF